MRIAIPEYCLLVLVGASGSGKSTFARKHFAPTEVISSDACRAMVSDDATDQSVTRDAFEVLEFIARKRLAARRLTVVDATSVRPEDRARLVRLAREYHAFAVAIVFDLPERVCQDRNAQRPDRDFGPRVVRNHVRLLRRSVKRLGREGFRYRFQFRSEEEVDAAVVERQPLWTDRRDDLGPVRQSSADVHGCFDELEALLDRLGLSCRAPGRGFRGSPITMGGRLVFLGRPGGPGPQGRRLPPSRDGFSGGRVWRSACRATTRTKLLRHLRGRRV